MIDTPKIVVLDSYTLNPGDLSWDELKILGECTLYDRTAKEDVINRAAGAQIILTNKTILDSHVIDSLPDMRYIGVMATGYNVVDLERTRERGIPVTNVPEYASSSVAQMTFALLLDMTQHVAHHAETVRGGRWCTNPDFCYWDYPMIELEGRTMGIIGYGSIGRSVARIARAFGMDVLVYDIREDQQEKPGITHTGIDTLFSESDVVSLHCPLTPETDKLINRDRLNTMKKTAYLINTGRGSLVDEDHLAEALNNGIIAGAALDVLSVEPPHEDNSLLTAKNCIITPHIAWASRESRARLMSVVVDNVRAYLDGEWNNVVNGV